MREPDSDSKLSRLNRQGDVRRRFVPRSALGAVMLFALAALGMSFGASASLAQGIPFEINGKA